MKNTLTNKLIKKILVSVVMISFIQVSYSQGKYFDERYIYSQAFLNPVLINAGAVGFQNKHQLILNYRNTWSGFNGSPTTATLSYDGRLVDRLGFGAMVMQDNFGAFRTSKGQLAFSYGITSPKNNVRFGLSTEFIQYGLNNSDADNQIIDPNDPTVRLRRGGLQFFDVSLGAYGVYDGKFTYGVALPSLISSRITDPELGNERELGFIFNAGYKLRSESNDITLEPSIIVKKLNNVPTHVDLNGKVSFLEERFTGGVSYTVGADQRLGFLLGFNVDKVDVYYTYNVSTLAFQDYNNGSHEFTFKLRLGEIKN